METTRDLMKGTQIHILQFNAFSTLISFDVWSVQFIRGFRHLQLKREVISEVNSTRKRRRRRRKKKLRGKWEPMETHSEVGRRRELEKKSQKVYPAGKVTLV